MFGQQVGPGQVCRPLYELHRQALHHGAHTLQHDPPRRQLPLLELMVEGQEEDAPEGWLAEHNSPPSLADPRGGAPARRRREAQGIASVIVPAVAEGGRGRRWRAWRCNPLSHPTSRRVPASARTWPRQASGRALMCTVGAAGCAAAKRGLRRGAIVLRSCGRVRQWHAARIGRRGTPRQQVPYRPCGHACGIPACQLSESSLQKQIAIPIPCDACWNLSLACSPCFLPCPICTVPLPVSQTPGPAFCGTGTAAPVSGCCHAS